MKWKLRQRFSIIHIKWGCLIEERGSPNYFEVGSGRWRGGYIRR